jgi:hypothetical protein
VIPVSHFVRRPEAGWRLLPLDRLRLSDDWTEISPRPAATAAVRARPELSGLRTLDLTWRVLNNTALHPAEIEALLTACPALAGLQALVVPD